MVHLNGCKDSLKFLTWLYVQVPTGYKVYESNCTTQNSLKEEEINAKNLNQVVPTEELSCLRTSL